MEDEELELGQGKKSGVLAEEMREEVKRKKQISSEACHAGHWISDSFFAALGAEIEEIGVGGLVIQITQVMSNKEKEEGEFGKGVIILMDATETEKGKRIDAYQKPF